MRRIHGTTILFFTMACGDGDGGDDEPAAETSTTTSTATSSTTSIDESDTSSETSANATSESSSSGAAPTGCDSPPDDPCLRCGFDACTDAYASCCALTDVDASDVPTTGCLPLVSCALATGCVHATCYQPDTCMAEVDGAGGITGDGTAAAGAFGDCLVAAAQAAATPACSECQAMLP